MKTALVTGVAGQDGYYLTELLARKNYVVIGVSDIPISKNEHKRLFDLKAKLKVMQGDICDAEFMDSLFEAYNFDEIYNLAGQSHVGVSFARPQRTFEVNASGVVALLERLRQQPFWQRSRFYQASTSEMFGNEAQETLNEQSSMRPVSPYGAAKFAAHQMVGLYRQLYGLHASSGILFNHESPIRGADFVTRKITLGLARILHGGAEPILLGNLEAERDWGHARDYVEAQWRMLQAEEGGDYVVATGETYSVREFLKAAAQAYGIILGFEGVGMEEVAYVQSFTPRFGGTVQPNQIVARVDPRELRPQDVWRLCGNSSKARHRLGWQPQTSLISMIEEMACGDFHLCAERASAV